MNKNFNVLIDYDDIETAYTTHVYPNAECMVSDTNDVPSTNFVPPTVKMIPKRITENGTYYASQDNADGYDMVDVDVEGGSDPNIQPLTATLTENGRHTFAIEEGVDGYYPVTMDVDVEPNLVEGSVTCTENTQTILTPAPEYDGFSKVTIDVDVEPDLENKNITANGTYTPSSDYDGFSQVTVNVPPEKIGTNIKYLCYAKFEGTDDGTLFTNFPLTVKEYAGYDEYLSYDETNKCLTVLTDFQAILVPWIVNYQVGGSRAIMGVKRNNDWIIHRMVTPSTSLNSKGYISNSYSVLDGSGLAELDECTNGMYISLHTGDTISIQKPKDNGFTHCYLKVYRLFDSDNTSDTFMDSIVNTSDTDTYTSLNVGGDLVFDTLNATQNGQYTPTHDGFSSVNVNVPTYEVKATHLELAHSNITDYETVTLDGWSFVENTTYLFSIYDASYNTTTYLGVKRTTGEQNVEVKLGYGQGWIKIIDSTHFSLWNYSGDYRNIFGTISIIPDGMIETGVTP